MKDYKQKQFIVQNNLDENRTFKTGKNVIDPVNNQQSVKWVCTGKNFVMAVTVTADTVTWNSTNKFDLT